MRSSLVAALSAEARLSVCLSVYPSVLRPSVLRPSVLRPSVRRISSVVRPVPPIFSK